MKKIMLLMLCLIAFNACKEDSNDNDNNETDNNLYKKAMVYYNGATWCGPCGTVGKPVYESLEATYGDDTDVILFTAHTSTTSDLYEPAALELEFAIPPVTDLPLPAYFVNFGAQSGTTVAVLEASINSTLTDVLADSAYASITVNSKNTNNNQLAVQLTVDFRTEQNVLGHSMQLFLYEKEVNAPQVGAEDPSNIIHKNVVREVAGEQPIIPLTPGNGMLVAQVELGSSITQSLIMDISGYELDNLGAFAVLWSRDFVDNKYINEYVNAIDIDL